MDAELRAHIESHAEYLTATGVPAEEARRRAELDFGLLGQAKESCRDARGGYGANLALRAVDGDARLELSNSVSPSAVAVCPLV